MFVLKILGGLFVIFTIFGGLSLLNDSCIKKYNHSFISKGMLIFQATAGTFIFVGKIWYDSALAGNGDVLNGQILIGIGIGLVITYILYLYSVFNLVFGTIGLIMTLIFLFLYIYIGIPCIIIYIIISIIVSASAKTVRVVN
ncbi:MAG: hypothetical protein ACRCVS_02465 [Fusobacteriaceae bacterium]